MVAAGIDLGSTHGCVGVFQNNKVNILANDQGFRTTPAFVTFDGDEVVIGDTAVSKLHSHSENTVFHLKRVLGKDHSDVSTKNFVKDWPFDVSNSEGQLKAATQRSGEKHEVSPFEFCTLLLKNLIALAQDFTGETVDKLVLSLPAHADDQHKQLLSDAAKEAGVEVLSFISEPLAAAAAYGLDEPEVTPTPTYCVVVDLGGATHDVTLLQVDRGLFQVVATKGNDSLGGEDFTGAVFEHCAKSFERKTGKDVRTNTRASNRLKLACEAAKKSLATQTQAQIAVDSLLEGEDFSIKLSRPRFEELIADYVRDATKEIESLLEEAGVEKEDVEHVVLAGGSTRIPSVQESVKKLFDGKQTYVHLSPDEVVAHGATIEASARGTVDEAGLSKVEEVQNVKVTPLTLSVALANGSVSEVIHRGAVLPATGTETFTTSVDDQEEVFLQIYEGERLMASDNTLIAQLKLSGISKLPKEEAEVEVSFKVSTDGMLSVSAEEKSSGNQTLTVEQDSSRLSESDVAKIVQDAEDKAEEDDAKLDELEAEQTQEEVGEAPVATSAPATPSVDLD